MSWSNLGWLSGLKRKLDETDARVSQPQSKGSKLSGEQVYVPQNTWNSLHPHQREAISFLLKRVNGLPSLAGAILADDMGTGKTCSGLLTMWIFCNENKSKGLILCPAGLIRSWESEIQKWLPDSLARTVIVLNGSYSGKSTKALDIAVNRFITSHPTVHPVLVLSYDLYRIYSQALSTMSSTTLSLLICDEGHHLKTFDSKLYSALQLCPCPRRIVMTGTPLQNNLDELYAVVSMALPNYLGNTLEEFHSLPPQELQQRMQAILLRRTKEQVWKRVLPPVHMRYLMCDFQYGVHSTSATPSIGDEEERRYRDIGQQAVHEIEDSRSKRNVSVFPLLLRARQLCSHGMRSDNPATTNDLGRISTPSIASASNDNATICSAKLRLLCDLIYQIHSVYPTQKIVIASSFLETLDSIKQVCRSQQWSTLRIDGSVPAETRQKIMQVFNRPSPPPSPQSTVNPFFILLLSTRAGGEGLTLTGACHLVLVDPDWNPSVDAQTLGRVYRPGQKHEVWLYRLCLWNTVEETMLRRQQRKTRLLSAVLSTASLSESPVAEGVVEPEGGDSGSSALAEGGLRVEQVQEMLFPADSVQTHSSGKSGSRSREEDVHEWLSQVCGGTGGDGVDDDEDVKVVFCLSQVHSDAMSGRALERLNDERGSRVCLASQDLQTRGGWLTPHVQSTTAFS